MSASFENYRNLEQALRECGEYVTQVRGESMFPLIRYRRDPVLIRPLHGELKRYDIAVYNRGDSYVVHRILEVRPDCYVFRGDNCIGKEYVPANLVIGKVTGFWRVSAGGSSRFHSVDNLFCRLYSRLWVALNPVNVSLLGLVRGGFRKIAASVHPKKLG